jgi:hypothetical protein
MGLYQIFRKKIPGEIGSLETRVFLIFTVVLVIGIIGYFSFRNTLTGYIFAHVGGLGILGLLAGLSGIIARKKNYSYHNTFLFSFFLPILLGLVVVGIVFLSQGIVYCGGGVSLAVAVIILISILLFRKRKK